MVEKFEIRNLSTNERTLFGRDKSCEYIYDDGIYWDGVDAVHNTYNSPRQIGSYISSTVINERQITVEAYCYYVASKSDLEAISRDEYVDFVYKKIKSKKERISRIVNPLNFIKITVGDYSITGKPNKSVVFGSTKSENNEYFCKFTFSLFCNNPMFLKESESFSNVSISGGGFHFPLILKNTGFIFGTRSSTKIIAVLNTGDVEVGCKIRIEANGVLTNPQVENTATGETIKINKVMSPGEVVEIITEDGENKGVLGFINGKWYDYIQYWSFSNKWFKIPVGTTIIGYDSDVEGEKSNMTVTVSINSAKFSLGEM